MQNSKNIENIFSKVNKDTLYDVNFVCFCGSNFFKKVIGKNKGSYGYFVETGQQIYLKSINPIAGVLGIFKINNNLYIETPVLQEEECINKIIDEKYKLSTSYLDYQDLELFINNIKDDKSYTLVVLPRKELVSCKGKDLIHYINDMHNISEIVCTSSKTRYIVQNSPNLYKHINHKTTNLNILALELCLRRMYNFNTNPDCSSFSKIIESFDILFNKNVLCSDEIMYNLKNLLPEALDAFSCAIGCSNDKDLFVKLKEESILLEDILTKVVDELNRIYKTTKTKSQIDKFKLKIKEHKDSIKYDDNHDLVTMQHLQTYFENLVKTKDFMEIIAHAMCLATVEPTYAAQAQEFLTEKYKTKNVNTTEFLQNIKEVQTIHMTNKAPLLDECNKPHSYWFENGIVI